MEEFKAIEFTFNDLKVILVTNVASVTFWNENEALWNEQDIGGRKMGGGGGNMIIWQTHFDLRDNSEQPGPSASGIR